MSLRCWVMVFSLGFLWALSFVFNSFVIDHLPPSSIVMFRCGIAFISLVIWLWIKKIKFNLRQNVRHYLIAGIFGFGLPVTFIAWGQNFIGISLTAIFNSTTPFFGLLAAHFFTSDEKITIPRLLSIILGVIGVTILFGIEADAGKAPLLGGSLIMLGTMSYGSTGVYIKTHMKSTNDIANCTGMMLFSFFILLPWVLWTNPEWPKFSLLIALSLISLGVLSSAVAFMLYFTLLREAGVANTLLAVLLTPVFATIMGVLFFRENIGSRELVGMGIILWGLVVSDKRFLKWFLRLFRNTS